MPRLKLIMNPAADHGHAAEAKANLEQVVELAAQGHDSVELTWVHTQRPGHATELAASAVEEGFDIVVAVGGDGTVHEVVNGLMQIDAGRRPRLGVIPVGSGNDFAHNVGLPDDPLEAARCIIGGVTRRIDAGVITDGTGRREYWNNTVGIGFSGVVNIVTRSKTRLRGFMIYFVSVLETILFKPSIMQSSIQMDDEPPFESAISMLSICNGPREGGGFPVNPTAIMDDGLISYTIMWKISRLNLLRMLPIVMNGNHLKHTKFFKHGTTRRIRLKTEQVMAIHTDGETFGPWEAEIKEIEAEILPGALELLSNC